MEEDTEPARKVRLVRCPNCKLLLPEPEDVLVYKCGGCDTILQGSKTIWSLSVMIYGKFVDVDCFCCL